MGKAFKITPQLRKEILVTRHHPNADGAISKTAKNASENA
jgi:hypothetical protein